MGPAPTTVWANDSFKLRIHIAGWVSCGIARHPRTETLVGAMTTRHGRIITTKRKGCRQKVSYKLSMHYLPPSLQLVWWSRHLPRFSPLNTLFWSIIQTLILAIVPYSWAITLPNPLRKKEIRSKTKQITNIRLQYKGVDTCNPAMELVTANSPLTVPTPFSQLDNTKTMKANPIKT